MWDSMSLTSNSLYRPISLSVAPRGCPSESTPPFPQAILAFLCVILRIFIDIRNITCHNIVMIRKGDTCNAYDTTRDDKTSQEKWF